MLHNLLIYRLLLWNSLGAVGVVWAWQSGVLAYLDRDVTGISLFILALAGVGLCVVFQRAFKVGARLNEMKAGNIAPVNREKFLQKNALAEFISSACVTLGFFGTVTGICIMLFGGGGIETSGTAESVKQLLTDILSGAGVAFITTAVGLATSLWLDWNMQILRTATISMIEDSHA